MSVIEIDGLTKDYGNQKGLFDVSFTIEKGEILGFLGPNGSGKTTLIRHLMGFIKPDQGSVSIMNLDCFAQSPKIQEMVGYLPGEIAFMDEMRGIDFIKFIAEMKKIKDLTRAKELIDFLELDPTNKIKRMSKGMKQKIGLVIAFMQDCPILKRLNDLTYAFEIGLNEEAVFRVLNSLSMEDRQIMNQISTKYQRVKQEYDLESEHPVLK